MVSANLPLVLGGAVLMGLVVLYAYRVEKPRNVRLFVLFGFASSVSLVLFLVNDLVLDFEYLDPVFLVFQWLFLGVSIYAHRNASSKRSETTGR